MTAPGQPGPPRDRGRLRRRGPGPRRLARPRGARGARLRGRCGPRAAERHRPPARARRGGPSGQRTLAGRGAAVLVTDAALLVEAGAHLRFDRLVVVHCDPGQQLEPAARARRPRRAGRPGAHRVADAASPRSAPSPTSRWTPRVRSQDTDRAADALAAELRRARRPSGRTRRNVAERSSAGSCTAPRRDPAGWPRPCSWRWPPGGGPGDGGARPATDAGRARPLVPRGGGGGARRRRGASPSRSPSGRCAAGGARPAVPRRGRGLDRSPHPHGRGRPGGRVRPGARRAAGVVGLAGGGNAAAEAARLAPLATRFGGGTPSGELGVVWEAVRQFPSDPEGRGRSARGVAATPRWRRRSRASTPLRALGETDALRETLAAIRPF